MTELRSRATSAHLIAGVALLFALGGGSALALTGVNRVNSGDIRNGSVRSADVRNNGLRGIDIRESTLECEAIPGADCSPDGTNPFVRGATADDGDPDDDLLTVAGVRFFLDCAGSSEIDLNNVSAGADSSYETDTDENSNFQPGDTFDLVSASGDANNIEDTGFSVITSNGVALHGRATVVDNPSTGFGGADCVGSITVARGLITP